MDAFVGESLAASRLLMCASAESSRIRSIPVSVRPELDFLMDRASLLATIQDELNPTIERTLGLAGGHYLG